MEMVRRILDATAQVLNDVGPDKLSTNRIAKRADVAVGSIYQYFPNKEALIDALVEDRMQRLRTLVETRMAALESHTFSAAAEAMLRAGIDFLAGESGLAPVLMSRALYATGDGVAAQLRSEVEAAARAFLERLDDRTVPDLDLAVFVSTNVVGLFGALLAQRSMETEHREQVIREIIRMLTYWMSTPRATHPGDEAGRSRRR